MHLMNSKKLKQVEIGISTMRNNHKKIKIELISSLVLEYDFHLLNASLTILSVANSTCLSLK